jgi:hypothetical protein
MGTARYDGQTFLDAGLRQERIEEPAEREYPFGLALRRRR